MYCLARLFNFLTFTLIVTLSSCEPSCYTSSGSTYNYYVCSGFTDPIDFQNRVRRVPPQPNTYFLLKDSQLDHIPAGLFANVAPAVVELRNVTVRSYVLPGSEANPFLGLEGSLRSLVFSQNSSLPESWAVLSHLAKLEQLKFFNVTQVNFTSDFNSLPQGLKELHILSTSVGYVDDNWLASLHNLQTLVIMVTDLKSISRGMLPKPALKLRLLQLRDNQLTSLPADLTEDLPALEVLDVKRNEIASFRKQTLDPLDRHGTFVDLDG
ncbi:unnamed protein product, partial [Ixodes hexagonus]